MKPRMPAERLIPEYERRIAHHINYRKSLIEQALLLSSSNPQKAFLLERAKAFAQTIENLQTELYSLYNERNQSNVHP